VSDIAVLDGSHPAGGTPDLPPLQLVLDLLHAGGLTATALELDDPNISWERYESLLLFFLAFDNSLRWYIGDVLNLGEALFGEKYTQAVALTGLRVERLRNYAWVCASVARNRRRPELGFSFHEAVASLAPREQRRWLGRAVAEGWTRDVLRGELKAADALPAREQPQWSEKVPRRVRLELAARDVANAAQKDGDRFLVPVEPMARLLEAVGAQ
jgi:hypothetical protein